MALSLRKRGRPRKTARPAVQPPPESVTTGILDPLPGTLESVPNGGLGDLDAPGQARHGEVAGELYALATRMPMLDAQIRRGAMQGIPRLVLLRANALVRYVRAGDPIPDYPHAIEPLLLG
jgi:hypothetical protein